MASVMISDLHDEFVSSTSGSAGAGGSPRDAGINCETNGLSHLPPMPGRGNNRGSQPELRIADFVTMGQLLANVEAAVKELRTAFHDILEGNDIKPGKNANYDEVEDPRGCFSILGMQLQQFFDNTQGSFEAMAKISATFQTPGAAGRFLPATRFDSRLGSRSNTPLGTAHNTPRPTVQATPAATVHVPTVRILDPTPERKGNVLFASSHTTVEPSLDAFRFGDTTPISDAAEDSLTQQIMWSSYASMPPVEGIVATAETDRVQIDHDENGNKIINGYEIVGNIGQGAFSKVKLAVRLEDDKNVAIKVMKKSLLRKARQGGELTAWEQVQSEIAIMKKMRHKNVVTLYEVIDDPGSNKLYLIMQYCEHGPVVTLREDGTCDPLPDETCRSYLRQLISGLHYLHRHNVVHRDIKPDNILRGSDDTVYLTDFGVSEMMQEEEEEIVGQQGTPAFFSPELCRGEGGVHGKAVDVWALGVTMYVLRFGRLPFTAGNPQEIMNVIQNESLTFPPDSPPDWVDLLRGMMNKDPRKRWTLPDVRYHEVLTGVKKEPQTTDSEPPTGQPAGFVRRMRRMTEYDVITINDEEVKNAIAIAPAGTKLNYRSRGASHTHFVEGIRGKVKTTPTRSESDSPPDSPNHIPQPPTKPPSFPHDGQHDRRARSVIRWDEDDTKAQTLPRHVRSESVNSVASKTTSGPPSLGGTRGGTRRGMDDDDDML